jgi:ankyrin repeat protein
MVISEPELMRLIRAIVTSDEGKALGLLSASPALAKARLGDGATREAAKEYFFEEILHYVYAGDTALHVAAASYRLAISRKLVALGADVRVNNRRGAEPLHYAVDGVPGSPAWDPRAQAAVVAHLIEAGADPNAVDKGGVTPLHRAVRNRCATAVRALLEGGADPERTNKSSSTPMHLATRNTGRGGTGSPEAKEQQEQIVHLLERYGAKR